MRASFAFDLAGSKASNPAAVGSEVNRHRKLRLRMLEGQSDANIPFDRLRSLLHSLGFDERIRGGHHIFTRADVTEILNLQPRGNHAKPYQVKQVREVILRYDLGGDRDEP